MRSKPKRLLRKHPPASSPPTPQPRPRFLWLLLAASKSSAPSLTTIDARRLRFSTSRGTGLQDARFDFEMSAMAALGVKEEVGNEAAFHHSPFLGKRTAIPQKTGSAILAGDGTLESCLSPKNEAPVIPQGGGHALHHLQYVQTFDERPPHHGPQQDAYARVPVSESSPTIETDRPLSMVHHTSGTMECMAASSAPQSTNGLILQNEGGSACNGPLKRAHGLNKAPANVSFVSLLISYGKE